MYFCWLATWSISEPKNGVKPKRSGITLAALRVGCIAHLILSAPAQG